MHEFRADCERHRFAGEIEVPIKCSYQRCNSSFTTLFNFFRDVNSFHDPEPTSICDIIPAVDDYSDCS